MNENKITFLKTGGDNPKVKKIGHNIQLILDNDPEFKGKFRYNSFAGIPETIFGSRDNSEWVGIEQENIREVINTIQVRYPYFDTGMDTIVRDQVILTCRDNPVSPPLEYFKKIKWDGVKRLDTWLISAFKVEDNQYYREIGRMWLKYLMKRLKHPGAKFDHVMIFEGDQGFGKSRILRTLSYTDGRNYFNETTETPDGGKNFVELLQGSFILEFAEGAIMGYKNQNKLKSFITEQADKYRPPYMRNVKEFPRQCVFAMTTNDKEYLKDQTGERRYWPVELPDDEVGDWEWVEKNRDQLFAEALLIADEDYVPLSKEASIIWESLILERKEHNEKEDFIMNWYESLTLQSKEEGVTFSEVKILMENDEQFKNERIYTKDITNVFTKVLFLKKVYKRAGSGRKNLYVPTSKTNLEENGDVKSKLITDNEFDNEF